jgi:hypothetical protein
VDTPTRLVLLAGFLYGFISFSAAVGAQFHLGPALPKWARACIQPSRASTALGPVAAVFVFILMAPASAFLLVAVLADSLRESDVIAALVSTLALAAAIAWVTFLVRWLRTRAPV